jgi:hypothetical protein
MLLSGPSRSLIAPMTELFGTQELTNPATSMTMILTKTGKLRGIIKIALLEQSSLIPGIRSLEMQIRLKTVIHIKFGAQPIFLLHGDSKILQFKMGRSGSSKED